jgi:hypothetical protein
MIGIITELNIEFSKVQLLKMISIAPSLLKRGGEKYSILTQEKDYSYFHLTCDYLQKL